jgi:hypothetical protein
MTDPRPEVDEAMKDEGVAFLNGKQGTPTHVAIDILVWKAALDILGTLPYSQVEQIIPAIRGGTPMSLGAGKTDAD